MLRGLTEKWIIYLVLTATDWFEVDKYLFSSCVYASCCCLFVFPDEVVRWLCKLVQNSWVSNGDCARNGGIFVNFSIREFLSRQLLSMLRLLSQSTFRNVRLCWKTRAVYILLTLCANHESLYLHRKSTELNCRICVRQKKHNKSNFVALRFAKEIGTQFWKPPVHNGTRWRFI